jgi:hypothetical protein
MSLIHSHTNNQDHSMMSALCAARNIAVNANLDLWSVNTDAEDHEGTRDGEDTSGRLVPQRVMGAEKLSLARRGGWSWV